MALFSPFGNSQYSDSATGALAVGYYVQTYLAGSSTLATTYTDAGGGTPNANSATLASTVILNAAGLNPAGGFWLTAGVSYKFVIRNAAGVVVETVNDITGVTGTSTANSQWVASGVAPTFVSGTSFTLAGDQTSAFQVGRRLQFTVTAGTVYGTISVSAFAALSTITVIMDGATVLDGGLSVVNLSILTATNPALPSIGLLGPNFANAGAMIAQRPVGTLSVSPVIGQCDMIRMWASTGAVSAGTITQVSNAISGVTGFAARAAGATLTGAAVMSQAIRMESRDALKYKNKTAAFQVTVDHDVGSAVNYTLVVNKPAVLNNFASRTLIATSSAVSVATGTAATLTFGNVACGDCTNGLELEIMAACGAVTTKNFNVTEFKIELGAAASGFSAADEESDLARCKRMFRISSGNHYSTNSQGGGYTFGNSIEFPDMRITPSVGANTAGANTNTGATAVSVLGPSTLIFTATSTVNGQIQVNVTAPLTADI